MAPKERRKGKKEIHNTNQEWLSFYLKFCIIGTALQVGHLVFFYLFAEYFSWSNYFFVVFGVLIHLAAYKLLEYMAKPYLGPSGELLEAGTDLTDSYFSEYAIDTIILTAIVQVLSAISNYFWILWLGAPGLIFYRVWVLFLWPWFTSGPPDTQGEEGKEGKKQKQRQRVRRVH